MPYLCNLCCFIIISLLDFYIVEVSGSTVCPAGYTQDNLGLGNCYRFATNPRNWTDARRECQRTLNGDLVVIESKQEYDYLRSVIGRSDRWVGLNDLSINRSWKWITCNKIKDFPETAVMISPLLQGDCAFYRNSDGNLAGTDCQQMKPYVCEITKKGYQSIMLKPTNITYKFLHPELLQLHWITPAYTCDIIGYRIKSESLKGPHTYGNVLITGGDISTYTLNVMSDNKYTIEIRAVVVGYGDIVNPNVVHLVTPRDVPTVPSNLRITKVTSSSVNLEWDELSIFDKHGAIVGYRVQYMCQVANPTPRLTIVLGETNTSVTITGLPPATYCGFKIQAKNDVGYGNYSSIIYKRTRSRITTTSILPTTATKSTSGTMDITTDSTFHVTTSTTVPTITSSPGTIRPTNPVTSAAPLITSSPGPVRPTNPVTSAASLITSSQGPARPSNPVTSAATETASLKTWSASPSMNIQNATSKGTPRNWLYILIIISCIILGNVSVISVLIYLVKEKRRNKVGTSEKDEQENTKTRNKVARESKSTTREMTGRSPSPERLGRTFLHPNRTTMTHGHIGQSVLFL